MTVGASIISGNNGSNCSAAVNDSGYNLESGTDCGFSGTGSLQSTKPLLGPLQNNGGPTQTMALQSSSPAIDAVPTSSGLCPATDQIGNVRPDNGETRCDIGAYEYQDASGPTLAHLASGTVNRAGRQITVKWQLRTSAGVAGFRVNGGHRLLNRSLMPVHTGPRYRFTVRYQGTGPVSLGVVLVSGQEVRVSLR